MATEGKWWRLGEVGEGEGGEGKGGGGGWEGAWERSEVKFGRLKANTKQKTKGRLRTGRREGEPKEEGGGGGGGVFLSAQVGMTQLTLLAGGEGGGEEGTGRGGGGVRGNG